MPTVMTVSHALSPEAEYEKSQTVLDLTHRNTDCLSKFAISDKRPITSGISMLSVIFGT